MKSTILLAVFSYFAISQINAQHWTGNVSSDWNNQANWSTWPVDGEDITIDAGMMTGVKAMPVITAASVFTPEELAVQNGAILTINNTLSTDDDVTINGAASSININTGGLLNVATGDNGRMEVEEGGVLSIQDGSLKVGQRLIVGINARVALHSGSISVDQRLIIEGGGTFIQELGSVMVGETFGIGDGSDTNYSTYELRGGRLTVTGEMSFENEAGYYQPTFLQTGGILQLNGDLIWFGESPGSGAPRFIQQGGESNITGIIENLSQSTVNLNIKLSGNAQMFHTGSLINLTRFQDSLTVMDGARINMTDITLANEGIIYCQNSQAQFTGSNKIKGTGKNQFSTIYLSSGELKHDGPSDILINGNVILNGIFVPASNRVIFNGSETQYLGNTISNNNPVEFYAVIVDNSSSEGISFNLPVNISYDLRLYDGKVNTTNTTVLNLEKDATSDEGSEGSFVNGPMSKTELTEFVFPVGKNQKWARIALNNDNNNSGPVTVEYFDNGWNQPIYLVPPIQQVSNREYWLVETGPDVELKKVALYWENAAQSNISNCEDLTIAYSGGQWTQWKASQSSVTGICSDNGSGIITSVDPELSYSTLFTFGFTGNIPTTVQNINLCPGEVYTIGSHTYGMTGTYSDTLITGNGQDSIVITILEIQNIDVSVSVNGAVISANNINGNNYTFLDCNTGQILLTGAQSTFQADQNGNYAVIVEMNGCADTSECVTVSGLSTANRKSDEISIYPNPLINSIYIENIKSEDVKNIGLEDIGGNKEYMFYKTINDKTLSIEINKTPGIYFLTFELTNGTIVVKKIVRI